MNSVTWLSSPGLGLAPVECDNGDNDNGKFI